MAKDHQENVSQFNLKPKGLLVVPLSLSLHFPYLKHICTQILFDSAHVPPCFCLFSVSLSLSLAVVPSSLSLFLSLSIDLSVSLSIYLFLSLSTSGHLSFPFSLSLSLSPFLSLFIIYLRGIYSIWRHT